MRFFIHVRRCALCGRIGWQSYERAVGGVACADREACAIRRTVRGS